MKTVALVAVLMLVALGCGTLKREAVFRDEEYAPYRGDGTATIEGQAFSTTQAGDVKFAAGRTIFMNPDTSYSREWWEKGVRSNKQLEPADSRATEFCRTTVADASGNFRFEKLPPGNYLVFCQMGWTYGAGVLDSTIVNLGERVHVDEGATVKVILKLQGYSNSGSLFWNSSP